MIKKAGVEYSVKTLDDVKYREFCCLNLTKQYYNHRRVLLNSSLSNAPLKNRIFTSAVSQKHQSSHGPKFRAGCQI